MNEDRTEEFIEVIRMYPASCTIYSIQIIKISRKKMTYGIKLLHYLITMMVRTSLKQISLLIVLRSMGFM